MDDLYWEVWVARRFIYQTLEHLVVELDPNHPNGLLFFGCAVFWQWDYCEKVLADMLFIQLLDFVSGCSSQTKLLNGCSISCHWLLFPSDHSLLPAPIILGDWKSLKLIYFLNKNDQEEWSKSNKLIILKRNADREKLCWLERLRWLGLTACLQQRQSSKWRSRSMKKTCSLLGEDMMGVRVNQSEEHWYSDKRPCGIERAGSDVKTDARWNGINRKAGCFTWWENEGQYKERAVDKTGTKKEARVGWWRWLYTLKTWRARVKGPWSTVTAWTISWFASPRLSCHASP